MNIFVRSLKKMVKSLLQRCGYAVVPITGAMPPETCMPPPELNPAPLLAARMTTEGALANMKRVGFLPDIVVDVGAAYGDFTTMCLDFFPEAGYLLMEPLREYDPFLAKLAQDHSRIIYVPAAAGREAGTLTINVHPDLVGSSFLLESEENSDVNGGPRDVRVSTVDQEMEAFHPEGSILLIADVQGAELTVLAGAEKTLGASEVVILETTLFNAFENGPLIHKVVAYMVDRGFCIYDITGNLYRPLDGALMQVDVIFTKQDSLLRRFHAYATEEQRKEQTELFLRRRKM